MISAALVIGGFFREVQQLIFHFFSLLGIPPVSFEAASVIIDTHIVVEVYKNRSKKRGFLKNGTKHTKKNKT